MKGGAETGTDGGAWTIGDEPDDEIDVTWDMGLTNEDGFRTGTVRPLDGLSIAFGSGSTNGVLSLYEEGDLGSGAAPLLLFNGIATGCQDGS